MHDENNTAGASRSKELSDRRETPEREVITSESHAAWVRYLILYCHTPDATVEQIKSAYEDWRSASTVQNL